MADSPTINSTWADIEKEAAEISPGPFVQALPGNKRITFPDPLAMDWLEVEQFMTDVLNAPNSESFKKWLSPADYKKFADAKPSLAQVLVISKRVLAHYNAIQTMLGEARASRA